MSTRTRTGAPRLPGIGSHSSAVRTTDEWLTPLEVLEPLGMFDLDPCAPLDDPHRCAGVGYTQETDGLGADWMGRVWLNPPYSDIEPWMARMAGHGHGIALVFARTETRWWQTHVWPHATAVLFLAGRLSFIEGATGRAGGHNAGGPSALIAYTPDDADVLASSGLPGALTTTARMIG